MDPITERILDKLDKIEERLDAIDKTLVKQEANLDRNTFSLEVHIARTDALEKHVKLLEEQFKPVSKHVDNIKLILSIFKWVGFSSIVSVIGWVIKYFVDKG